MAIYPKDLMLGNYLQTDSGTLVEVDGISRVITGIVNENETIEFDVARLYPIPITEQWLKDFGFTQGVVDKSIFSFDLGSPIKYIWFNLNPFEGMLIFGLDADEIVFNLDISYIHQLQNLMYALGYELKLKEG